MYGFDSLYVSDKNLQQLERTQGNLIKQCLGLSKRSRSSNLLHALGVLKIEERLRQSIASLLTRVFAVNSSIRELTSHFLSQYICRGTLVQGTLVERAVSFGLSPTQSAFNVYKRSSVKQKCGIVDSLQGLLMHENFIKPYSEEHVLTSLLTKAF
jgi:hypothetical protein